MNYDILVSVICNTYNHENYIADAIESFLMQKTNFKYEILIHDDASTDKTTEIIKEYENMYPDIIKPIYQNENQYSKGARVGIINRERAIGKYYALCEGDDYWNDPNKLQKQVDFLEQNEDFSVCVHSATIIDSNTKKKIGKIRPCKTNKIFSIQEIIEGGGGLFPTNSMVYRRDMGNERPDFYFNNKFSFGDYQLMILLAIIGKVYYIDENMSTYRYNVPGSWSSRNMNNATKLIKHNEELSDVLDSVNEYTKFKYDHIIQKTKEKNSFYLLVNLGKIKEAKSGLYMNYYNELSLKNKVSINLKSYFPKLHSLLYLIKERILNGQ